MQLGMLAEKAVSKIHLCVIHLRSSARAEIHWTGVEDMAQIQYTSARHQLCAGSPEVEETLAALLAPREMVLLTLTAIAAGTAGAGVTWSRCLIRLRRRVATAHHEWHG